MIFCSHFGSACILMICLCHLAKIVISYWGEIIEMQSSREAPLICSLFSIFLTYISSICPNSEQPNFSQDISPFWQLNSEHGSFQLAEPAKTLSFYWLSSTKRSFCICNLIIIRISISVSTSIFKLRIVLLDKRLILKLKRKRWASGLMGSKIKSLP